VSNPECWHVEWLPKAENDRAHHIGYIAERNLLVALELDERIQAAADQLAYFPHSAPAGRIHGTRELIIQASSFILVFRIEMAKIVVLALLHSAQQWPPP
jgi:toxin ParE1/3/4